MDTTRPQGTHECGVEGRLQQSRIEGRLFGRTSIVQIGRFVVLETLGEGGMGTVYLAYDTDLDRRVAVKVLSRVGADDHAELRREAVVLARLNHPNVVTIHEVGEDGEELFVAMEHVDGGTLQQWCLDHPEPSRERTRAVLRMAEQAIDGLAAAHALGVVHRDVKPANMLLGADGRLRVADFGLARSPSESPTLDASPRDGSGSGSSVSRTGAVVGTLAYMAPEQLEGSADPRSDQFGLCATFFEALYGRRPFGGETIEQRREAFASERVPSVRVPTVPPYVHRVLSRGMALRPEDRFPSMEALKEALHRGARGRRHRAWAGAALAVTVGGGATAWGLEAHDAHQQRLLEQACAERASEITAVWNDDTREQLRTAFVEAGIRDAPTVVDTTVPWIDDYARQWRQHRESACLDATVHETLDAESYDESSWCLELRRIELEGLVQALSSPDELVAHLAVSAASGLPPVALCSSEEALGAMVVPDPKLRPQAVAVREVLSRASSLRDLGRLEEGLDAAREAIEEAQALGWPPLMAEATATLASQERAQGEYEESARLGRRAFTEAVGAGAWGVAEASASELVSLVGRELGRHDEAEQWGELAAAVLVHARDPLQIREAARLRGLGLAAAARDEYDLAIGYAEQAKLLYEQALGPRHLQVARLLGDLSDAHRRHGAPAEAKRLIEAAIDIEIEVLGPNHPAVAAALDRLAVATTEMGDLEDAIEIGLRCIEIREHSLGPDHPDVAGALGNLAQNYLIADRPSEAKPLFERALKILEAAHGPGHPQTAIALGNLGSVHNLLGDLDAAIGFHTRAIELRDPDGEGHSAALAGELVNLGNVYAKQGRLDEAKPLYTRALAIMESTLGPTHRSLGTVRFNLGNLHQISGEHALALPLLERAVETFGATMKDDHPYLATARVALGKVLIDEGRLADAIATLERARATLAIREPSPTLAEARFALARALWDVPEGQGRDRARACALLERARGFYAEHDGGEPAELAALEAWGVARRC